MANNHARTLTLIALMVLALDFRAAFADVPAGVTDLKGSVQTPTVGIGDLVEFQVPGLANAVSAKQCDPATWQLVMDNTTLVGPKPLVDLDKNVVRFRLDRSDADKNAWIRLLGEPPIDGLRTVSVGIRLDPLHELSSASAAGNSVVLVMFKPWRAGLGLMFLVLAAGFFVYFARTSDIVRDAVPLVLTPGARRPYSLARCQLAFWSFLVTGSFLLIWIVTGDYNHVITQQTFILLGISSATGMGAVAIDGNKPVPNAPVHISFLDDLLTDVNGITVYRFQLLLWTIVLGVVYITSVYQNLSTPDFDANLLTLMGISSGTYLGFKIPEKQV